MTKPLYFYINGGNFSSLDLFVNDAYVMNFSKPFNWRSVYLGTPTENSTTCVRLDVHADGEVELDGVSLYMENPSALDNCYELITWYDLKSEMISDSRISADVNIDERSCLIYTIPFDSGWKVRVDGSSVSPECAFGIFPAIPLESGAHHIELHFVPRGFIAGLVITLAALLLLLIPILRKLRLRNIFLLNH